MTLFRDERNGLGSIRVDAFHQGRIFLLDAQGKPYHRWDQSVADKPSDTDFNNLGGNSLWPAPEGGPYAFNYLEGDWLVQPGINTAVSELDADGLGCSRRVKLLNRKGTPMDVRISRRVTPLAAECASYGVEFMGYHESDAIEFASPMAESDAVVSAWSLEQFASPEGVIGFGKVGGVAAAAMNTDFYGDPGKMLRCDGQWFRFELGGQQKYQIGLSNSQKPEFVAAYKPAAGMLIVRSCETLPGKYINFADNEQPDGVFSADDQMSIFNGASMDFFELETLGPVQYNADGLVTGSRLEAETRLFIGEPAKLLRLAKEYLKVPEWVLD